MGGGSSASASRHLGNAQNNIVQLMMPLYYTKDDLTPAERIIATDAWKLILNDTTPEFLARKGTPDFPYASCVIFFYDNFYARLFDIHPMARVLFKSGMKSQGKFLVQMISLALSELDDKEKFDRNLVKLAEIHNQRGVKAVEYGVVGDVLFWCLKHVVGSSAYTPELHKIWVKIYSRMLRTIVPVAVAMELKDGSAQVSRLTVRDTMMFSKESGSNTTASNNDDDDDGTQLKSEQLRTTQHTSVPI